MLNNYLDQDIDRIMERTKKRALAAGEVSGRSALIMSVVLGVLGLGLLAGWVNWLVFGIGVVGFVVYVWLYGALSKRHSIHGTAVGSVSGAMPILAGYCAVSGRIDSAAILVFLCLFFWQFPEFYSIAIYRRKEYKAASIPVLPVVRGVPRTITQIFIYTVAFVLSALALMPLGYEGYSYFVVMLVIGIYWIKYGNLGFRVKDTDKWARQMFHKSLIVLMVFSVILAVGSLLP